MGTKLENLHNSGHLLNTKKHQKTSKNVKNCQKTSKFIKKIEKNLKYLKIVKFFLILSKINQKTSKMQKLITLQQLLAIQHAI